MALSHRLILSIIGILALLVAAPAVAQPVKLVSESYHVPARDPGFSSTSATSGPRR
jgi:hypothetical protein